MKSSHKTNIYYLTHLSRSALSLGLSTLLRRPIVWGLPTSVMIEPTNRCNLHCPLCPSGAGTLTRPHGEMTLSDFKKIIRQLGQQVRRLYLWNQGEPLLNKALPEMIRFAHSQGIYTVTSTNGILLGRENVSTALIQAGLDDLIVSIDGLTPETYKIYRVGGELQQVISGMKTLRRLRDEQGARHPRIILQWLPMKHNEHELPDVKIRAAEWGADAVEIKTTQIYSEEDAEKFLPENLHLSRYQRREKGWEVQRRYQNCRRLWFSCQIDWDGTVVPCCFDKDEEVVMGNLHEAPLAEIWRGKKYQQLRHLLLTQGRILEMCRNCTEGLKTFYVSRLRIPIEV
ncbi:radical SAM protein [bacterium]|nr:radical SAM protein [bacterium]